MALITENDQSISLLERSVLHCVATAKHSVFYGQNRDQYDERGRTAHECIFNTNDGQYRCPNSQQGYSGFSTWTRGLAWAMLGFSEQLEFINHLSDQHLENVGGKAMIKSIYLDAAKATCDFYIANTPTDGIPYWDTGAPGLQKMGDYLSNPADPYNNYEPVDSSAATIAAQALLRLGRLLKSEDHELSEKYWNAGLSITNTLLSDTYLCSNTSHQGLILHSIYHQPNGWDHVPQGRMIACEESSMWGDYHMRELAIYLWRIVRGEEYYTFFNKINTND